MAIPINRRNIQSIDGDGHYGDTFEAALKAHFNKPALVSRGRAFDFIMDKTRYEIKTGAGELGRTGKKACAGVSYVIYCPVYDERKPIDEQEAFIVKRDDFINLLQTIGLYRESKTPTNGRANVQAIQTFWNRSKNAPHGKKYYALIDSLYDAAVMEWETFLNKGAAE